VRRTALGVFERLAEAEARVHGVAPEDVHFHEVGALDSIADVVGTCAAIHDLDITEIIASPVALGSGRVRGEHGELPVPVPAVLELSRGWIVSAGGDGELATPTGLALISTLASSCSQLPALRIDAIGVGAGSRDIAGRANVVRVVLGEPALLSTDGETTSSIVTLAANVDDLDPRVWPSVLSALLQAGASDAWLAPILMKKGRPAHTLHVLAPDDRAAVLRRLIMDQTSTIGVREMSGRKYALPRTWITVELSGGAVRLKVAHRDGVIVQATPEFEDVHALADVLGVPTRDVLTQANAAAAAQGLTRGSTLPNNGNDSV
jgi:pyridinium-3,5-bisthiocarboxylic acid mononucleotide nickel chelatase